MREGSNFINTCRGAQVDGADLTGTLKKRPDITALLDVTFPEPPGVDSELWILLNVWITPISVGPLGT